MIVIICAMSEERDAFLRLMEDVHEEEGEKLYYQGKLLDNRYYIGKIADKEVALVRSGVGKTYSAMITTLALKRFEPELLINCGCAGSTDHDVHVSDVVVCERVADWDIDVPGWDRSFASDKYPVSCDEHFIAAAKKAETTLNIHFGNIVSGDQFIYQKEQVEVIKKYFPTALCGEMEGSSIARVAYAMNCPVAIIRSISDETLVNGNYLQFDFNLAKACDAASAFCKEVIKNY